MNIVLCTINPSIELAWREALVGFPALHPLCEILTGNITELAVDAVVSPANSFGFMDGGIDLHYSTVFGGNGPRADQVRHSRADDADPVRFA